MNELAKEIWKKKLEEQLETSLMIAEKTNEYRQIEKQIKKIIKSNKRKIFFNKLPFIHFKLKQVPELPKLKMEVIRPTLKYEVKE
jgi:hypothetical protein